MIEQNEFRGFAKVEVMGHQSHVGFVTTEAYGGTVLFRIDQPPLPEEDIALSEAGYVGNEYVPAGTVVKYPAQEGVSVLVGAGSIYRIVPCTEAAAMKAIRSGARRPLMVVSLPTSAQIAAARDDEEFDDDDEGEDDGGSRMEN